MKRTATLILISIGLAACGSSTAADDQPTTPVTQASAATAAAAATTEAPATTDAPIVTEAPATTAAPITTEAPTTEAPTTIEAPTTTLDPIQAAGAYYMAKVTPVNCINQQMNRAEDDVYGPDGSLTEDEWARYPTDVAPLYAADSSAELTLIDDLANYQWPVEVQDAINALTAEMTKNSQSFEEMASFQSYQELVQLHPEFAPAAAGAFVRAVLGLPAYDDTIDYCV